jgi:hypothetical protein
VADLVLSGVTLERCGFVGSHGLDRLRIEATCTLQSAPRWRSRRLVFAEEVALRQTGRRPGWWGWLLLARPWPDIDGASPPTAAEVAGLYRGLRKGLEDAKNEPAAADFYYGEMEMRRQASRGVERGLLALYWAVSGYGLRAWRAFAALLVVLAVSAALFTQPGFARIPQPPERIARIDLSTGNVSYAPPPTGRRAGAGADVRRAVEFTARESLTITRGTGAPLLETTGRGTAVDLTLRLLAPLLLGLALLAVRGRTKR